MPKANSLRVVLASAVVAVWLMGCEQADETLDVQNASATTMLQATTTSATTMLQATTTSATTMLQAKTESLGSRLIAEFRPPFPHKVMPQSLDKALQSADWAEVGSGSGSCHPKFGRRFRRKGVMTPTLMYDNTGHIAGMQFAVDTDKFPLYPDSNLKAGDSVVPTDLAPSLGNYALTIYFSDPSKICSASPADHAAGSIGDRLWMANAGAPLGHEAIPFRSDDGVPGGYASSGCTKSGQFFPNSPGMGTHWWRVTRPNGRTPCNELGPMGILYSRGRLVGIVLRFVGFNNRVPTFGNKQPVEVRPGQLGSVGNELWEFGRQPLSPYFHLKHDSPECLANVNRFNSSIPNGTATMSSLHVFFSDPQNFTCP